MDNDLKAKGAGPEDMDRIAIRAHVGSTNAQLGQTREAVDGWAGAATGVLGSEAGNKSGVKGVKGGAAPIDFDHVIGADYNQRRGTVTGGHSTLNGDVKVVEIVREPDANGVYEAKVQMQDSQGNWIDKTSRGGLNTMFPTSWTRTRIEIEIDSAWRSSDKIFFTSSNGSQMWRGKTTSGVTVEGFVTPKSTAYPIYGG